MAGRPVLFQRIEFATEVNPVARIAYGLYRGKFLSAVSVGFIPLRWQDPAPPGRAGSPLPAAPHINGRSGSPLPADNVPYRRKYLEQELLEVSAVSIPANPNALALALKSGAINKSDLQDVADLCHHTLSAHSSQPPARHSLGDGGSAPNPRLALALQFAALLKQLRA
jgi:hypothetical protein